MATNAYGDNFEAVVCHCDALTNRPPRLGNKMAKDVRVEQEM